MGDDQLLDKPRKPTDRWLGLAGIAIAIILYLVPKTKPVIIGCLAAMWLVLIHPTVRFWWIEKRLWRQCAAVVFLIGSLVWLGFEIKPDEQRVGTALPSQVQTPPADPQTPPAPQQEDRKAQTLEPKQNSRTTGKPAEQPLGAAGIAGSSNTTVEMSGNSQIVGFKTGIQGEDHLHVVMKDQSRIDSNSNALPSSTDHQSTEQQPSAPGLHNIGIKVPATDLPLNPIPIDTSSKLSPKDQIALINALVKQWRDDHPNWTVIGRNAIRWMNRRLEEQGKDFRIKMPEHCNPLPGVAGVAVPSEGTQVLNGVVVNGAPLGVMAGQNSTVKMNNTQIVVDDNCD
jgi:hypothetical protein